MVACTPGISSEESQLADDFGLDPETTATIRGYGTKLERLTGFNDNYEVVEADGSVFIGGQAGPVADETRAIDASL